MEKRPFFDIFSESDEDLKEKYSIDRITFEEDVEKDDMISFTIHSENDDVLEDEQFSKGAIIKFRFGFLGLDESETRIAHVTDTDCEILNNLHTKMTVRAYDKGQFLKKSTSKKVYSEKTASQIAEAIASMHRLKTEIKATDFQYKQLLQGNRTDFELLKYLASKEEDYQFYIRDNTLYFLPEDLKSDSTITIEAGNTDSRYIKFIAKNRTSQESGAETSAEVSTIDKKTGKEATQTITQESAEDTKLNDFAVPFDADAKEKISSSDKKARTGNRIITAEKDPERAKIEVKNTVKKANRKAMKGPLITEGFTKIRAGKIITLGNVKKYGGNYYVKSVKHDISNSGYLTTAELQTNALKKATSKTATSKATGSKNKTTGPEKPDTRREIVIPSKQSQNQSSNIANFDANANKSNS